MATDPTSPGEKRSDATASKTIAPDAAPSGSVSDGSAPESTSATGILRRPLAWIAMVLLAALIGVSVALVLALTGPEEEGADAQADQVRSVAREYALALSNLDYRTVDENRGRATALTTEEFRGPTGDIFTAFAGTLAEAQAVTTGTADEVGVASMDADSAVALVFLDQTSTNVVHPDGQIIGHRLRVELVREDGQWLVSGAAFR